MNSCGQIAITTKIRISTAEIQNNGLLRSSPQASDHSERLFASGSMALLPRASAYSSSTTSSVSGAGLDIADPRVQDAVQQVDDQVRQQEHQHQNDHRTDHRGPVLL